MSCQPFKTERNAICWFMMNVLNYPANQMETRSSLSRPLHTNRGLEKLEPYEGKLSCTVLRGEEGSNALDLPDRPSDLAQRDGRGVRAGNEIAKLYADNKVDVIIYAVEKSLDSYKFNLLHCKQTFISQLKSGALGARTIDEGAMDEKSGMNFSEYMAILSGNTDLLDKAKLEKKIASLEGERKSFNRGKRDSELKLKSKSEELDGNRAILKGMTADYDKFMSQAKKDKDGNILNLITLNGLESNNLEVIGKHLQRMAKTERTDGEYKEIGAIYGFPIKVVSETSFESGLPFVDNRFVVENHYKYQYNNGHLAKSDPIAAANNFLNALRKIPSYIEQYDSRCKALEKEIPQLQEIAGKTWKKEDELKGLKAELVALERKIQFVLTPKMKRKSDYKAIQNSVRKSFVKNGII